MKIVQHSYKPQRFDPIDITIRLETLDDVRNLWHRTNLHRCTIDKSYTDQDKQRMPKLPYDQNMSCHILWQFLNHVLTEKDPDYSGGN